MSWFGSSVNLTSCSPSCKVNIKLNEEWACIRCEGVKISAFSIEVMYDTGFRCVECPISARIISHEVRSPPHFLFLKDWINRMNRKMHTQNNVYYKHMESSKEPI